MQEQEVQQVLPPPQAGYPTQSTPVVLQPQVHQLRKHAFLVYLEPECTLGDGRSPRKIYQVSGRFVSETRAMEKAHRQAARYRGLGLRRACLDAGASGSKDQMEPVSCRPSWILPRFAFHPQMRETAIRTEFECPCHLYVAVLVSKMPSNHKHHGSAARRPDDLQKRHDKPFQTPKTTKCHGLWFPHTACHTRVETVPRRSRPIGCGCVPPVANKEGT